MQSVPDDGTQSHEHLKRNTITYYVYGVAVDWSKRGDYIAKHGVTPGQADEALNDANAVIFDPDYNTISGQQVRTIGYSPSARTVLSVITLDKEGVVWGVNAWKSNSRDGSYYREGGPDEQEP